MKGERIVTGLTAVNLVILVCTALRATPAIAANDVTPVLRGRALEIVDDAGRVRAMIGIFPADPSVKMPDGTRGYPETVLLRLIDSHGGPNVKIAATDDGAGISLTGSAQPTYIQLMSRGASTSLTLVNKDGKQQRIAP